MTTQGAARKARPNRTTNKPAPQPQAAGLDLDALLADKVLLPAPVTLRGKTYLVRTDLTSMEVTLYLRLAQADKELEGYQLLVGDDAESLMEALHSVPRVHQRYLSAEILRASKALADFAMSPEEALGGKPGES